MVVGGAESVRSGLNQNGGVMSNDWVETFAEAQSAGALGGPPLFDAVLALKHSHDPVASALSAHDISRNWPYLKFSQRSRYKNSWMPS